ncbi:MAG TPA: Dyp-type peroxidase [Micromonosporaceae bacterium]
MTIRRWLATALLGLALGLGIATPAWAHDVGGVGATNFRTTLSELDPVVPGVSLRVVENGARLELRNDTAVEVVVDGYGGEPYARVGPTGVFLNDNSPARYLNTDRYSNTAVPAGVDGRGPPRWRQVADQPAWRWHDHRVHWMLGTLPPVVAAAPTQPHRISDWTITLHHGEQVLTARGSLDWVPGPSPWPWFAATGLAVAGVAALPLLRRPHRLLAAATAIVLVARTAHGLGVMLVTTGSVPERLSSLFGSDAVLVWPFSILAVVLLWRGHTRASWISAAVGFVLASTLFLDDAPVWWRSSAPTALPMLLDRATVAVVVGAGLGLIVALPVMLRRQQASSAARSGARPRPTLAERPLAAESTVAAEPAPTAGQVAGSVPSAAVEQPVALGLPGGGGVGRRQAVGYLAAGALGALAGAAGAAAASGNGGTAAPAGPALAEVGRRSIPFHGQHQAGIAAPARPQAHAWVAAFDLAPGIDRAGLGQLLRAWTEASARLTAGQPLGHPDDGVVTGLGPAALTVTFGFGSSMFGQAGVPAAARPAALAPLPAFEHDQLDPAASDGDLGLVIAGDDPVVVAHAARVVRRLAGDRARLRWQVRGFNAARGNAPDATTPRNLMGQVDGTANPAPADPDFAARVFVATTGPAWLRGGSYLVVRRIRMLLDDWDRLTLAEQEAVIGRRKDTGAPLSGGGEHTAPDFGARSPGGALLIPEHAHIRLATPAFNDGAAMLRRGFSYTDGDATGLLFLAWQADPGRGFIPVQRRLSGLDSLRRFIRHESSALFAAPAGAGPDSYIGQALIEG